jgi:hypothetical protein
MKKQYIKPQAEMWFLQSQTIMRASGHNNNMPEAKEQSFSVEEEEEKGPDYVGSIKFRNVWDEDDN